MLRSQRRMVGTQILHRRTRCGTCSKLRDYIEQLLVNGATCRAEPVGGIIVRNQMRLRTCHKVFKNPR